ncbi:MAG: ATPase [Rhodospirillales bacterium]|nr:ATPase [Rhodospirillales bacterium]
MSNLLAKGRLARWSGAASITLASLTAMAAPVLAATAEHGGEHAKGGLPQLNPATFPTQIFWLALSFGALYYLLSKKALPIVAQVLEERQERISRDLSKAASLKDEAESVMATVDKALAEARVQAQAVIAETVAAIEADNQARQSSLNAQIADRLREAETRINAAKEQALANVRGEATDIVREIASKLAGIDADPAQAEAAVAAVTEERR